MEPLRLVQNDTLPTVSLRLTDVVTGAVLNVSAATTTITARIREAGSNTVKESIPMTKPNGGVDGVVAIVWTATALNTPGEFEVEVELNFNGYTQTVYDVIPMKIRPQFG